MLENCPKYTLTEGPCEGIQTCLLSHTCHHMLSQVLHCLRILCKRPLIIFLKYHVVKMNADSCTYRYFLIVLCVLENIESLWASLLVK